MSFLEIGKRILVDLTAGAFDGQGDSGCTHSCSTCPNAGSCGSTSYSSFRPQGGFEFERSGNRVEVDPSAGVSGLSGAPGVQLDVGGSSAGRAAAGEFTSLGERAGPASGLVMARQAVSAPPGGAASLPGILSADSSVGAAGERRDDAFERETDSPLGPGPAASARFRKDGETSQGHKAPATALSASQIVNEVLQQLGIA